ncbi:hypothetical protein KUTeg_002383 [Tegillarca granosa]|uniref:Uncharacterized protein n=1 Tax=Tegillarca granosa TaxID=220873 RepID=A0ABQ9FU70_TEGGR|nr:hypothetical protein KUTeg_002383 [Tegillarca granosa]
MVAVKCYTCTGIISCKISTIVHDPHTSVGNVFVRKGLDWVFTQNELKWLDDIMPETHKRAKEDEKIKQDELEEQEKKKFQDEKRSPHIGSDLPTIPHSPTEKRSTKKKQPVTFFIEEGEEEQLLNKAPEIVVDPPSDNTSINRDDESIA